MQLKFTNIVAPISGRAGTINVTRGNNVKTNDSTLVTINRVMPIFVQMAIPQRYYDVLRGASGGNIAVTAQRSSDGQLISTGKLEYIDNMIDSSTGTFKARAAFSNTDEQLWPGMFVNILITLGIDQNAAIIPQVALQNGQEGVFVFVADTTAKKAVKRNVEVLRTQDNKAAIKSGLQAGEKVIIDGLFKLNDGSAIVFLP